MPQIPDFDDPRPVFAQIADDLRAQIASGRLGLGTRLASQSDLAKRYGVATNTLRAALKELAGEGIISTQSTRGTFVLKLPGAPEPSPEYTRVVEQLQSLSDRVEALEARIGESGEDPRPKR